MLHRLAALAEVSVVPCSWPWPATSRRYFKLIRRMNQAFGQGRILNPFKDTQPVTVRDACRASAPSFFS